MFYLCCIKLYKIIFMNRFRKMVTVVTALFALQAAMAQDDVQITFDKLPAKAQNFVKTHSPKEEVASVWKDTEMLRVEDYTVALSNGTEVEFLPNGEWKEIKSRGSEIPASIIPSGIRDYVKKNYASSTIKDIKKKRYGYEVELTGDIDLEFNSKGKFLRVDD